MEVETTEQSVTANELERRIPPAMRERLRCMVNTLHSTDVGRKAALAELEETLMAMEPILPLTMSQRMQEQLAKLREQC